MKRLIDYRNYHKRRIAIVENQINYSYGDLEESSNNIAFSLLGEKEDLHEMRVGLLLSPSFKFVSHLWGIWKAGGIAVPLNLSSAESELHHYIKDSKINLLITEHHRMKKLKEITQKYDLTLASIKDLGPIKVKKLPSVSPHRRAMIIYTSGTTNKPKGVVSTHANIQAQVLSLIEAWGWNQEDYIPLILPLHHIHGLINSLICPLWIGAKVEILGEFKVDKILNSISSKNYSVFTAVPTIYFSLIKTMEKMHREKLLGVTKKIKKMRLMMSGSSALAPEIHKKWTNITGQILLERYGMTEIGMALSNPLVGKRMPGYVGKPLPNIEVALLDDKENFVTKEDSPGEILCKGPQVFLEYWKKPEETKNSFYLGWFKTGDIAILHKDYYKILGRKSVDIIKSGGFKVSALEVEDFLLKHPKIQECSVVGIESNKWGEAIAAAIVTEKNEEVSIEELKSWGHKKISNYKLPKIIKVVESLPKNSLGKVNKPKLKEAFQ